MKEYQRAVLSVSSGTTDGNQLREAVEAAEFYLQERFAPAAVYRAFADRDVRRRLRQKTGVRTDDVQEALERVRSDGFMQVCVLPLYLTDCREYRQVKEEVEARIACGCYTVAKAGRPLMVSQEDIGRAAGVLAAELPDVRRENTAVLLTGFGESEKEKSILKELICRLEERVPGRFFSEEEDFAALLTRERRIGEIAVLPLEFAFQEEFFGEPRKKQLKKKLESLGYRVRPAEASWGQLGGILKMFVDCAEEIMSFRDFQKE